MEYIAEINTIIDKLMNKLYNINSSINSLKPSKSNQEVIEWEYELQICKKIKKKMLYEQEYIIIDYEITNIEYEKTKDTNKYIHRLNELKTVLQKYISKCIETIAKFKTLISNGGELEHNMFLQKIELHNQNQSNQNEIY